MSCFGTATPNATTISKYLDMPHSTDTATWRVETIGQILNAALAHHCNTQNLRVELCFYIRRSIERLTEKHEDVRNEELGRLGRIIAQDEVVTFCSEEGYFDVDFSLLSEKVVREAFSYAFLLNNSLPPREVWEWRRTQCEMLLAQNKLDTMHVEAALARMM